MTYLKCCKSFIRTDARMLPSNYNSWIVVDTRMWDFPLGFRFSKRHTCYLNYYPKRAGVGIDYRTKEQAESAAQRCYMAEDALSYFNLPNPYKVVQVKTSIKKQT